MQHCSNMESTAEHEKQTKWRASIVRMEETPKFSSHIKIKLQNSLETICRIGLLGIDHVRNDKMLRNAINRIYTLINKE